MASAVYSTSPPTLPSVGSFSTAVWRGSSTKRRSGDRPGVEPRYAEVPALLREHSACIVDLGAVELVVPRDVEDVCAVSHSFAA